MASPEPMGGGEPPDLTSSPHSLHRAVQARRSEFLQSRRLLVKVGTWNVGASPGTDKDLASWFIRGKGVDPRLAALTLSNTASPELDPRPEDAGDDADDPRLVGGDKVDLYVLGLQEVVDLNVASQYMSRVYNDTGPGPVDRWRAAMEEALPVGYERIVAEQMSGLLLLVYASPETASIISNVSTSAVGTGVLGYLGNKGAVSARILLGETTRMVFLNSHLSSGADASSLERRLWDFNQIISRTAFAPVSLSGVQEDEGDKIGDEDFAFWFGDLNFRLEGLPGDDIRRLLMLHSRGEYGQEPRLEDDEVVVLDQEGNLKKWAPTEFAAGSAAAEAADDASSALPDPDDFLPDPSEDPASLQATLDSLLPHDQLRKAIKGRKAFYDGWREGPITFPPSYKYDVGTVGLFDSGEKRRAPSWCDRILFRSRRDKKDHEIRTKDKEEARKKDEEMTARGIDHAADEDRVLWDYDPEDDADDQADTRYNDEDHDAGDGHDAETGSTEGGTPGHLHLDIYTSHQRIQSSDHKPVTSVFTIDYEAVAHDLKARVHAEVARELDRAENEGRPSVTVVVDGGNPASGEHHGAVHFGEVEFLRRSTCSLTIANTGRVAASIFFVDKPTTENADQPGPSRWLSTSFVQRDSDPDDAGGEAVDLSKHVCLRPGETATALLEVFVDDVSHARMLNDGQRILEDVLVLRVADGRDHFIPVQAAWAPSCIGRSVDELIRVPDGGIRRFVKARSQGRAPSGSIPYELEVRRAAPKELLQLLETMGDLLERVLADEHMLQDGGIPKDRPGWPLESHEHQPDSGQAADVVRALDEDSAIGDAFGVEVPCLARLEVVSHVLLRFLDGLTDGIVDMSLWSRIEQSSLPSLSLGSKSAKPREEADEDDKAAVLDVLSSAPNHNVSFVFLTSTISKMLSDLSKGAKSDLDGLSWMGRGIGSIGRRTLSFKRGSLPSQAQTARDQQHARETRFVDILAKAVCRAPPAIKGKERKATEDRQRLMLALFLKGPRGGND